MGLFGSNSRTFRPGTNKQTKSHKERETCRGKSLISVLGCMCDGGVRYAGQLTGIFIRPLATRTHMHTHTNTPQRERERENPLLVSSIRRLSCVERMRVGKTPGTRVATRCFRRNSLYGSSTPAQLEVLRVCVRLFQYCMEQTVGRFAFLLKKFKLGK